MKKKTILFIYCNFSTFVKKDYEILKEKYNVISLHATKNLLKTIFKLLWNTRKVDLVFIWFAGWHAFLAVLFAKIFRKKSIVIVGGYDAACVPQINYGVFCSWWRGRLAKFVYKHVDLILAGSNYLRKEIEKRTSTRNLTVLYPGVNHFLAKSKGRKEQLVVSVGTSKIKNVDTIVETATHLPKVKFLIIGKNGTLFFTKIPPNVKFIGYLPHERVIKYLQKAKVYLQISSFEGMGISLIEAMFCGCIPVVTGVGGQPEAVGEAGFYVPLKNPIATAKAIRSALKKRNGKEVRERAKKLLTLKKRARRLYKLLDSLFVQQKIN